MTRPRITVGVVDYGVGNHASVARALQAIGLRGRVSGDPAALAETDLLLLPGVGAFPAAMGALESRGLVGWLRSRVRLGQPLVGICLGMQLLADGSSEFGQTAGLGLIPGRVDALSPKNGCGVRWHIGWNRLEVIGGAAGDPLLAPSDGQPVYFNHSFVFDAPAEYRIAVARCGSVPGGAEARPMPVAVRRAHVVGLQFHPEKSQAAGRTLLRHVIEGLVAAAADVRRTRPADAALA